MFALRKLCMVSLILSAATAAAWPCEDSLVGARELWRNTRDARALSSSVAINLALWHFGFFPVHAPNVTPSKLLRQPEAWLRVDSAYLHARAIYTRGLQLAALGAGLYYSPEILAVAKTYYYSFDSGYMRNYEERHYNPRQVVADELRKWEAALDRPPTSAERASKEQELEQQERAGVFHVYKK